ncbi:uncharacterized protein Z520_07767 [Fonsecaea multimorphosa CBS 102226]|uniref:Uncharacterized protein n=1 Tax=Fonsecaea multimorphosa CBS 102226 TaxID=1442371 RepID=A0A0D2IHJ4_9EURO|nr:uncharacterized protein Z520_07767 [Fonsecaea multimorphosa CBS 102226]KIX96501.1 hypothetical protein Z520_07767 [Fonsecaea multimorphosa CBS 102226]
MSVTNPGWCAGDTSDAAKALHTLLKNLESHKGGKRKHRDDLQYLQHYLLPRLRLIGAYIKAIDDSDNHPRKGEWEADLRTLAQAWQKFEEYLKSRHGLLSENPSDGGVKEDLAWTWDELSEKIKEIKLTARGALDDIDRLILLEICERFGLVLPRLDNMFEKIESYGECVSTYRKDVQEVLYTIRSNKQDFKSLKSLLHGSMTGLAEKISDSQSETEAIKSQLQAMSEKLDRLLARLAEQRSDCTTKTDRKYLDQLIKEVKKQAASVARLRASIDETMGLMAEFLRALEKLDVRKGISHCAAGALADLNDMLSKTTSSLERLCESLMRQTAHVMFKKAWFWRREKSTDEAPSSDHDNSESHESPSESQPASPSATNGEDTESADSSTLLEQSPAPSNTNTDAALSETTTSSSPPMSMALPAKSAGISIQDLAIILASSPEEAAEAATAITWALSTTSTTTSPPPLPRKSSARKSYQYVLRSLSQRQSHLELPSLPAVPGRTTPPPPPAAGAGLSPRPSSRQHSKSSSWSSMSLALSSSEMDSPCPQIFSAPSSLPSAPSSVYESSIPEITTSYACADDTTAAAAAAAAAVGESAKESSLLDQLERRYSSAVVPACT